jgi:hypothetical protein
MAPQSPSHCICCCTGPDHRCSASLATNLQRQEHKPAEGELPAVVPGAELEAGEGAAAAGVAPAVGAEGDEAEAEAASNNDDSSSEVSGSSC